MEEQSDTPRTEMAEGQRLNPYFEGRFDGESDELCALRLTLARERDEARAIANDRDAMVDHRDRALTAMYQRVDVITRERDEARARVSDLVENGERLKAVADLAVRDAADMAEAKCALLRDRIERQVAEAQRERDEARADLDRFRHTAKRYRYLASWCSVMSADIDGNHYWVSRISSARLRGESFEEAVDKAMERDHWERSALAATEAKP